MRSKELYGWLLLSAASKGNVETSRFCKDQGEDPNFKDKNGSTPLWQARVGGNDQMVEALKEWGAHGETDEWWGKSDNKPVCCTVFYTSVLCRGCKNGLSEKNLVSAVEDFARNKGYKHMKSFCVVLLFMIMLKSLNFVKVKGMILIAKMLREKRHWIWLKNINPMEWLKFLKSGVHKKALINLVRSSLLLA